MPQQNHESDGIPRIGPNSTPDGQSIDEAVLEPDEPKRFRSPADPTLCFQHAATYPMWSRFMPQEARLKAAITAWVQFEARQRAAPDDCDVMDVLRLAWNDPAGCTCMGSSGTPARLTASSPAWRVPQPGLSLTIPCFLTTSNHGRSPG